LIKNVHVINNTQLIIVKSNTLFALIIPAGISRIAVLDRQTLQVLYQFGMRSEAPGNFRGPHELAVDSKGNLFVAEVEPGNRVQKFVFKGLTSTPPANALTRSAP